MSRKSQSKSDLPEIEEIKKGFELFDLKGTGKIDPKELKSTMEQRKSATRNLRDKKRFRAI